MIKLFCVLLITFKSSVFRMKLMKVLSDLYWDDNHRLLFKAQLPGLWKWYSNEDKNMKRKPRIKKCSATCEGLCIETMITKLWWLCQLLWWLIQINARIWHLQKIWKRGTSIREKGEWHKMIIDEGVIVQEPSHDRKKKTHPQRQPK